MNLQQHNKPLTPKVNAKLLAKTPEYLIFDKNILK